MQQLSVASLPPLDVQQLSVLANRPEQTKIEKSHSRCSTHEESSLFVRSHSQRLMSFAGAATSAAMRKMSGSPGGSPAALRKANSGSGEAGVRASPKRRPFRQGPPAPVTHLPRGGVHVQTCHGAVQFGIPPETIKDSMALGLEVRP